MDYKHELACQLVESGANVFITGNAGTGKSFILNKISRQNENVFATATTGVASILLNVQCPVLTLHSWAGIGIGNLSLMACVIKIRKNRKNFMRIKNTRILIIDEISMLDAKYFDKLNSVLKVLLSSTHAFGGIQVVLCGDFLQLKPPNGQFIFNSKAWKELNLSNVYFETNYRQNDQHFSNILSLIRKGIVNKEVIHFMKSKRNSNQFKTTSIKPTKLLCTNTDVDKINYKELSSLNGKEITFFWA